MNNNIIVGLLAVVILMGGFLGGTYLNTHNHNHYGSMHSMMDADNQHMSMEIRRDVFLEQRNNMVGEMLHEGDYSCCLEKPCTYCIEKTPGHGEGASCNCLEDVVTGMHPCGECIGEILEGHGNPLLAEYFAEAIAEEVGDKYKDTLMQIISDKYGLDPGLQV